MGDRGDALGRGHPFGVVGLGTASEAEDREITQGSQGQESPLIDRLLDDYLTKNKAHSRDLGGFRFRPSGVHGRVGLLPLPRRVGEIFG